jgi:hypothetical protein
MVISSAMLIFDSLTLEITNENQLKDYLCCEKDAKHFFTNSFSLLIAYGYTIGLIRVYNRE